MSDLEALIRTQSGVVSRRQALEAGLTVNDVRRRLRRRDWAALAPGVYVDHTGAPTWLQKAWGAVLSAHPAVLGGRSALRAGGVRIDGRDDEQILVVVARDRSLRLPEGIKVRRCDHTFDRALHHTSPPRLRLEDALLDVVAQSETEADVVTVLAAAFSGWHTTAERLSQALAVRRRYPRRALVESIVGDVAGGSHSALEHAYLVRVERAHGLPRSRRQVRTGGTVTTYRDVEYQEYRLVVELDGLRFHSSSHTRDADLDRDLERAVAGVDGVRLGWAQVVGRPCRTARSIGALLRDRGWLGQVRSGPCCR